MVGVGLKCGLMDRVYLKEGRENREAGAGGRKRKRDMGLLAKLPSPSSRIEHRSGG
jgi:hypothetical protein